MCDRNSHNSSSNSHTSVVRVSGATADGCVNIRGQGVGDGARIEVVQSPKPVRVLGTEASAHDAGHGYGRVKVVAKNPLGLLRDDWSRFGLMMLEWASCCSSIVSRSPAPFVGRDACCAGELFSYRFLQVRNQTTPLHLNVPAGVQSGGYLKLTQLCFKAKYKLSQQLPFDSLLGARMATDVVVSSSKVSHQDREKARRKSWKIIPMNPNNTDMLFHQHLKNKRNRLRTGMYLVTMRHFPVCRAVDFRSPTCYVCVSAGAAVSIFDQARNCTKRV